MRSPLTLVSLALALCSAPSLVAASGAGHHEARSHLRHHARAGVRELRLRQRDGMSVLQAQVGKLFAVVFDDDTVDDAKLAKANKGSTTKADDNETTTAKKALRTTTTVPTTTTTTTRRRTTTTTEEPKPTVAAEVKVVVTKPTTTAEPEPTTTTKPKPKPKPTADASSSNSGSGSHSGKGLIGFKSANCGPSGATAEQPNGSEEWLNCGMSVDNKNAGWTPPQGVTIDMLATVTIEQAMANNDVWAPCAPYIKIFEKAAADTGLPPILLASFALQESTCQAHILGDNNGAFGLMQITKDKCSGKDAVGCSEPWYNVYTAAKYFKSELDNAGGNFLEAAGRYNGWYPGLTINTATAPGNSPDTCDYQQNLDYHFQMVNGWMLGKTGYTMGSHKNLAKCH